MGLCTSVDVRKGERKIERGGRGCKEREREREERERPSWAV